MSQPRLITRCPHCDTMFRVTADQLDTASGKVRCSRCRQVFNARDHLQESASRPSSPVTRKPLRREAPPSQPIPPSHDDRAPAAHATTAPDIDIELEAAIRATSQLDLDLQGNQPTTREQPAVDPEWHTHDTAAEPTPGSGEDRISYEEIDLGFDLEGGYDSLPESAIREMVGDEPEPLADQESGAVPATPEESALDTDFDNTLVEAEPDEIEIAPRDQTEALEPTQADDATHLSGLGDNLEHEEAATPPEEETPSDGWLTVDLDTPPASHTPDETEDDAPTSYELAMDVTEGDHDQTDNLFSDWGQNVEEITYPAPPDAEPTEPPPPPSAAEHADTPHPTPVTEEAPMDEVEGDDEAVFAAIASVAAENEAPKRYGSALEEELEATLTQPKHRLPTLLFGTGSLLLLVLLLVQSGSAFHDQLARYPLVAPLATLFCTGPECTTTQRRAPQQIRIINRDVRPHPSEPGALLISLTFVNEAPFPQPYPVLEISFSDTQDRLVALRRFQPSEYLSGEHRSTDPLAPSERAAVSLSVVDPGEQGVSYRFEFY